MCCSAKIYVPVANNVEFEQDRFFYVQLGVPKRSRNDTRRTRCTSLRCTAHVLLLLLYLSALFCSHKRLVNEGEMEDIHQWT